MSEDLPPPGPPPSGSSPPDFGPTDPALESPPASPIRIMGQYIKDLSFETPHAPDIFAAMRTEAPEIPIGLDTNVRHMSGSTFEVNITTSIEANVTGKKAFILELSYACVVEINTQIVPQEHVHPVLMIEVPRQMFPFIRQLVADITGNGGFPPLMLQVFDFADMYRRKFGDPTVAGGGTPGGDPGAPPQPAMH